MDSFRNFDENYKIVLDKINEASQSVGKTIDDDKNFQEIGCKLHRYFDLDETDKDKIYSSKKRIDETHSGTVNDVEHMDILKDVLKDIKNKNRLIMS